jgi:hypothetical protein
MSRHLGLWVTGRLRRGRPRARLAAVAALAAAGAVMAVPGAAAAGTTTTALGGQRSGAATVWTPAGAQSPAALNGPQVFGWGFDTPAPVATDGTDVWVANFAGNSVTELSASGAFVQVTVLQRTGLCRHRATSAPHRLVNCAHPRRPGGFA